MSSDRQLKLELQAMQQNWTKDDASAIEYDLMTNLDSLHESELCAEAARRPHSR